MTLTQACLLFLVQLAFGSALTFVCVDRETLGPKYFKFGGWILGGLYGLALALVWPWLLGEGGSAERGLAWCVVGAASATLAFASVSGWDRPRLESALLGLLLLFGAAAVGLGAVHWQPLARAAGGETAVPAFSGAELALVLAGAYGSALVLGFTIWSMTLGHWYLVDHGLDIKELGKLVTPLAWIYLAKIAVSAAALWFMWGRVLGPGNRSMDDMLTRSPEQILDVVNVWARIPVGLVVPLILAYMARVTVRMEKTQPATGILYAMCGMVILGDLMGKMLEGVRGVPL